MPHRSSFINQSAEERSSRCPSCLTLPGLASNPQQQQPATNDKPPRGPRCVIKLQHDEPARRVHFWVVPAQPCGVATRVSPIPVPWPPSSLPVRVGKASLPCRRVPLPSIAALYYDRYRMPPYPIAAWPGAKPQARAGTVLYSGIKKDEAEAARDRRREKKKRKKEKKESCRDMLHHSTPLTPFSLFRYAAAAAH